MKKFLFICLTLIIFLIVLSLTSTVIVLLELKHKGFYYAGCAISFYVSKLAYVSFKASYFPELEEHKTEVFEKLNPELLDDGTIEEVNLNPQTVKKGGNETGDVNDSDYLDELIKKMNN
tara:strand:+ start:13712 stop:14068 length:357 start_codon:yes stop_codon:yes gene_type:complete